MSDGSKKRKGTDGGAVSLKVKSGSPSAAVLTAQDGSMLSPIQNLQEELWKDDSGAVAKALSQLELACHVAVGNRAEVYVRGGARDIVGAMRKWRNVLAIQARGCRALNYAAFNDYFGASAKDTAPLMPSFGP